MLLTSSPGKGRAQKAAVVSGSRGISRPELSPAVNESQRSSDLWLGKVPSGLRGAFPSLLCPAEPIYRDFFLLMSRTPDYLPERCPRSYRFKSQLFISRVEGIYVGLVGALPHIELRCWLTLKFSMSNPCS